MRVGLGKFLGVLLGVLVTGACVVAPIANAMPPYPGLEKSSPEMAASVAKYKEAMATFAARGINQHGPGLAAGTQLSGNFNMLVVCVRFTDHDSSVSATDFDDLIFSQVSSSVWDYYHEVSYGNFDVVSVDLPSSIGWQTMPSPYSYYVNNNYGFGSYPQNTQKLCEDVVDAIDGVVDFADYDNDGNGYVDGIIIVHSGTGAELSGQTTDIWSHKWGITPRLRDGVYISDYSIQPEYWLSPGDITIGVYCHEIGHVFGLPDLYDIDGSSRGIGKWSLMANGSWNGSLGNSPAHVDAWCRIELGFVSPTIVNSSLTNVNIPSIESTPTIFRLWEDGTVGSEFFLVENRQKTGYDSYIPSSGLLIWHVDETQTSNSKEWYPGHTSTGHYWVALEQADGLWEIEQNTDYGDSGDPFPGSTNQTFFSAASTPSSDAYSGTPTYVTITNISSSSPTMTCDFQVSLGTGVNDGETWATAALPEQYVVNQPNPFNPSTLISYYVTARGHVTLDIYDILGRRVRTLVSDDVEPGRYTVEWNGADDQGRQAASGVYFARMATPQYQKTHKMVLVR